MVRMMMKRRGAPRKELAPCNLDVLPYNVIRHVSTFLDYFDLRRCCCVSKIYRRKINLASIAKGMQIRMRQTHHFCHIFISQINNQYYISKRKIDKYACLKFREKPTCHHIVVSKEPIGFSRIIYEVEKHNRYKDENGRSICKCNVPYAGQMVLNPSLRFRYSSENSKLYRVENQLIKHFIYQQTINRTRNCALCNRYEDIQDFFLFSKHFIGRGAAGKHRKTLNRAFSEIYLQGTHLVSDTLMHFGFIIEKCILDLWMNQMDPCDRVEGLQVRHHLIRRVSTIHLGHFGNENHLLCCSKCFFNESQFVHNSENIRDMIERKGGTSIRLVDFFDSLISTNNHAVPFRMDINRYIALKMSMFSFLSSENDISDDESVAGESETERAAEEEEEERELEI